MMDDLISRAAACDEIGKMIHEYREKDDHDIADALILSRRYVLKRLPAVDAAPVVHGKWDDRHVDYVSDCAIDEVQTAKCSVCGLYHTTPYMYSFTDYKYCPNCGAKNMEE